VTDLHTLALLTGGPQAKLESAKEVQEPKKGTVGYAMVCLSIAKRDGMCLGKFPKKV